VPAWTFLTNHGHVFFLLARRPDLSLREVGEAVGITERAALSIVNDLEEAGYVTRTRVGRRNRYQVHADRPLRHPLESDLRVGEILDALVRASKRRRTAGR
jgi:DNA-binding Lrp family transcriptional regulator